VWKVFWEDRGEVSSLIISTTKRRRRKAVAGLLAFCAQKYPRPIIAPESCALFWIAPWAGTTVCLAGNFVCEVLISKEVIAHDLSEIFREPFLKSQHGENIKFYGGSMKTMGSGKKERSCSIINLWLIISVCLIAFSTAAWAQSSQLAHREPAQSIDSSHPGLLQAKLLHSLQPTKRT
jgi:hypothetical protein